MGNLIATVALAKIQADGLWTGHDLAVVDGIGVENGLAYGTGDYARMLKSAQMAPGDMSDYMSKDNVKLVASFVTQQKWDFYFPDIHNVVCTGSKYSYEGFLKAIAKYPSLCGENNNNSHMKYVDNPDTVASDGYIAWAAAVWFYMTPLSPKPSIHDILTGYCVPNAVDEA